MKVLDTDECSVTNGPVFYRIVRFQTYLPNYGFMYTTGHKMSGFEKLQEYMYTVKKNSETLPQKNGQQRKFQIAETFPHVWGKMFSNLTRLTV